jgi:transcriptional regulator with XRE-family HTH domain
MEQAGLSTDAVAATVGVTASAVSHWRSGPSRPGPSNMVKLAALLGVTTDYLLSLPTGAESEDAA